MSRRWWVGTVAACLVASAATPTLAAGLPDAAVRAGAVVLLTLSLMVGSLCIRSIVGEREATQDPRVELVPSGSAGDGGPGGGTAPRTVAHRPDERVSISVDTPGVRQQIVAVSPQAQPLSLVGAS